MKKFNALVCYDIADSKRLAKVAKVLEKVSIRIQKSIFYLMDTTTNEIKEIAKILEEIIDEEYDDVRIYKVDKSSSLNLKSAINLKQPNIIKNDL
ncbi:CRISPR-associated endonuclease Cas2 [Sulfurimonas hydrogeniphila]|uniref:CRISPR-associated endonuclease Cas2 n=1 Tax=Sulfurimonas hydrogeniphila TaxID=2509341 RepID=UPI00125ECB32|nr:CRISPR-associated endonuclease Cas2 [Sulfurimonas hydrogeniphila]